MAGFKAHSRYSSSDPVPESVSCEYPDPRDLNASLPVTNDLFSKTLRCGLLDAVPGAAEGAEGASALVGDREGIVGLVIPDRAAHEEAEREKRELHRLERLAHDGGRRRDGLVADDAAVEEVVEVAKKKGRRGKS